MILGAAPGFWWRKAGWQARLLAPAAALYGAAAARRLRHGRRMAVEAPVLCVGNPTAGGAGKTPTALALAEIAQGLGRRPGFLSRGHGGSARVPLLVDPARHDAAVTGDEPQLLARIAPTVVSPDRVAGARLLLEAGCDLVLMDDGFQSARLRLDLALLVVDGRRGLGNGRVLPAGPLRAPLDVQFAEADAVLVIGEGEAGEAAEDAALAADLPVHRGRIVARGAEGFAGTRLLAFAGIADPGKFHASLRGIGAEVAQARDFGDHHVFTPAEIEALEREADAAALTLATTAKDAARLAASPEGRALLQRTRILDVDLRLDGGVGEGLIARAVKSYERRRPARSSASSEAAASR